MLEERVKKESAQIRPTNNIYNIVMRFCILLFSFLMQDRRRISWPGAGSRSASESSLLIVSDHIQIEHILLDLG